MGSQKFMNFFKKVLKSFRTFNTCRMNKNITLMAFWAPLANYLDHVNRKHLMNRSNVLFQVWFLICSIFTDITSMSNTSMFTPNMLPQIPFLSWPIFTLITSVHRICMHNFICFFGGSFRVASYSHWTQV